MTNEELATRILVVYEAALPMGGESNLRVKVEAMVRTIKVLGLQETSGANLLEAMRAVARKDQEDL